MIGDGDAERATALAWRRPPVFSLHPLNMSEVPRAHIFVEDTRDYPEEGPLTLDLLAGSYLRPSTILSILSSYLPHKAR